ncbi:hypothetical protein [Actinomycetospora sp. TBRC 11914]|uniref:hypothetical protein n=1 Tax=Actinomycetospora sp. TBRC 11914 TaxID=2729387 RepID=UPI00145E0355|nr:hypothetical protein [Actinomycetospora sp. TBRC 11914]NMO88359.1 hypothetical protein [Actinomycetospora sp. TBRC 11914]
MSVRMLAVVAELVLAAAVTGWGITTAVRPDLWTRRPVRWWTGWGSEPIGPWEGVGVALAGAGMALSGAAAALATPAMPLPVRVVQLTGLAVLVLGGALLAVVHPTTSSLLPLLDGEAAAPDDGAVATGPGASTVAVVVRDLNPVRAGAEAPV